MPKPLNLMNGHGMAAMQKSSSGRCKRNCLAWKMFKKRAAMHRTPPKVKEPCSWEALAQMSLTQDSALNIIMLLEALKPPASAEYVQYGRAMARIQRRTLIEERIPPIKSNGPQANTRSDFN